MTKRLLKHTVRLAVLIAMFLPCSAFAHRPLTTQSAYPVDIHKVTLETGIKYTNFRQTDDAYTLDVELNYGIINNLDIGVEVPYVFWRPANGKNVETIGDMILKSRLLFLKGREGNPISLTIQPFFKVPTPENDIKVLQSGPGLSTGETDFGFLFIATREMDPLVAHMNLGYTFINKPSFGPDFRNVFSFKVALEYKAEKGLELVGELKGETNKDPHHSDFFSILLGSRYELKEGVSVDVGYDLGLSDASPYSTATVGVTLDF